MIDWLYRRLYWYMQCRVIFGHTRRDSFKKALRFGKETD